MQVLSISLSSVETFEDGYYFATHRSFLKVGGKRNQKLDGLIDLDGDARVKGSVIQPTDFGIGHEMKSMIGQVQ